MYPPDSFLFRVHPSKMSNSDTILEEYQPERTKVNSSHCPLPLSTRGSYNSERNETTVTWENDTNMSQGLLKICQNFSNQRIAKDTINRLKESTRQLMFLLEEIQSNAHCKNLKKQKKLTMSHCAVPDPLNIKKIISVKELELLQHQMRRSDNTRDCSDDCSVYKRLTRKCNCLTVAKYNDFVIQFNEEKMCCFNNSVGEIIKNIKIVKKFVYMGGEYTQNALEFLNEGLAESNYTEKVNILTGISHADVCNVFTDDSIVVICIEMSTESSSPENKKAQFFAAKLLNNISEIEEGRRYLSYSSKVTDDINRLLTQSAALLDYNTLEALNATFRLLHPPLKDMINVTHFCTPLYAGTSDSTINALTSYRQYMSMDEIFTHLALLHKMSRTDKGKDELSCKLPMLLQLLRRMVLEYDNNDMNVLFVNVLNNVITHQKKPEPLKHHVLTIEPKVRSIVQSESMQYSTPRQPLPVRSRANKKRKLSKARRPSPDTSGSVPIHGPYFSEAVAMRWVEALRKTKELALLSTTVVERDKA